MVLPSSDILSALEERAKRAGAKACEDSVQVHGEDGKGARRGMSEQANCKSKLEEGLLVSVHSPTGRQQRKPLRGASQPRGCSADLPDDATSKMSPADGLLQPL